MDDKNLMEDILLTIKGVSDLYLHGVIESSTPNIHTAFKEALCESLTMEKEVYDKMAQKGWYPQQQVEQQKIDKVKETYSKK